VETAAKQKTEQILTPDDPGPFRLRHSGVREKKSGWGYLLIPLVFFSLFMLYPVFRLIILGFQELDTANWDFRVVGFAGLDNFRDVLGNKAFTGALVRSFLHAFAPDKLVLVVFLPLVIAASIERAGEKARRSFLTFLPILVLGASVWITALLILPEMNNSLQNSGNRAGFWLFYHFIDIITTLSYAVPFGVVLYYACRRGEQNNHGIAVPLSSFKNPALIILVLIIPFSLQAFTLPQLINFSFTESLMVRGFNVFYLQTRPERGGVYFLIILIPVLLSGLGLWRIVEGQKLKLVVTGEAEREGLSGNKNGFFGWVIVLFIALLIVAVYFLAFRTALQPRRGAAAPRFPVPGLGRSVLVTLGYIIITVGMQTFVSWLGGYGLGMFRSRGGRAVSAAMHITAGVTPVIPAAACFVTFARLHLLETIVPSVLIWFGVPLGIILYKLFYEGVRGTGRDRVNKKDVFLMTLFVATILLFLRLNALFIPLLFGNFGNTYLLPAFLYRLTFSFQPYLASDITAFALLIYTPGTAALAVLLMFLGRNFFPRIKMASSSTVTSYFNGELTKRN